MNRATERKREEMNCRGEGKNNHPKLSEPDMIKIDFRMLCNLFKPFFTKSRQNCQNNLTIVPIYSTSMKFVTIGNYMLI